MYLTKDDGLPLLRRVVDRFPSGELQFDAFNTFGIRTQVINSVVRRSGSTLYWGIDGPADILDAVPGVRLLAWESVFDSDTFDLVPPAVRWMGRAMARGAGAAEHGAVPPLCILTGMPIVAVTLNLNHSQGEVNP